MRTLHADALMAADSGALEACKYHMMSATVRVHTVVHASAHTSNCGRFARATHTVRTSRTRRTHAHLCTGTGVTAVATGRSLPTA